MFTITGRPQSRTTIPRKVWIVAPNPPPYGGMSVQAEKVRQRLRGEGIKAELIPTNPAPIPVLRIPGRIPLVRTMIREMQYLLSLRRIAHEPGVVHHLSASYLFFFLHSAPLLLIGTWLGWPVVLNYRGGKAAEFLRSWSWAAVPLLRCADQVTVPSGFLQRVFKEHGVSSTVLANLADIELFPFVERECFSPRFLVTRNLEPMYGLETVLAAFRKIQKTIPESELGVVGEGSEATRLLHLVRAWELRGVTFYGVVPYEQLPAIYRHHDIYLNASRVDNFPGALVEAACAGLPIVTTRAGGIPDMIRHRENGLVCHVDDVNALAGYTLELLRNQDLARRLARSARDWAEQFSWRNVFPQLLRCYGFAWDTRGADLHGEVLAH